MLARCYICLRGWISSVNVVGWVVESWVVFLDNSAPLCVFFCVFKLVFAGLLEVSRHLGPTQMCQSTHNASHGFLVRITSKDERRGRKKSCGGSVGRLPQQFYLKCLLFTLVSVKPMLANYHSPPTRLRMKWRNSEPGCDISAECVKAESDSRNSYKWACVSKHTNIEMKSYYMKWKVKIKIKIVKCSLKFNNYTWKIFWSCNKNLHYLFKICLFELIQTNTEEKLNTLEVRIGQNVNSGLHL